MSPTVSACEPHRTFIESQLRLKRNFMAIYQDLVDQHGFTGAYNSVKRFAGGLRQGAPEQFDRLEFAPREEAQVDYGEGAPTRVLGYTRYRKPRLFVMTLRYSRRSFRRVVWKSSQETWVRLHEDAWDYFGGASQYVMLDNLKEGVIKPDLYEPELNAVYAATLAHWETRWAAPRIHGSARHPVEAMFQEERPHLLSLPVLGMNYFSEEQRTVCDDSCIRVDHSSYAARSAPIGSVVLVRLFEHRLEVVD